MINNEFYKTLGEAWFTSEGDAIALLRQENAAKLPWLTDMITKHSEFTSPRLLDVGCGGGLLSLALADKGYSVTALDVDDSVMAPGQRRDIKKSIQWTTGDAHSLPFSNASFEVVCAMDVLEHVQDSQKVLKECARVLVPGGILFLHTFNRSLMAAALAAHGLNWWIKGSPNHIHDWRLFIKPNEMRRILAELGLEVLEICGIHPVLKSRAFLNLILTRRVPKDFRFKIGGGLNMGYLVCAGAR